MVIAIFTLMILISLMFSAVEHLQGNARVINYAGIVRGATQRVVKNELYGIADDAQIQRLDSIIAGLQYGGGTHALTVLNDITYQKNLDRLAIQWEQLKERIYAARQSTLGRSQIYALSESYFILADQTVSAAEAYADGTAKRIQLLEILVIINVLTLLLMLFYQIAAEIIQNRKLRQIAYVDANTGLPNKRKCEEMLNEEGLISEQDVVCCFMFDLNNLKMINDTMGHKTGDALIMHFASVLKRTAPADMFVGRFGGDEFIGIWKHTDGEKVQAFLEKLNAEIRHSNDSRKHNAQSSITISFAYGYALSSTQRHCTIKTLMDLADQNMYQNKREMKSSRSSL